MDCLRHTDSTCHMQALGTFPPPHTWDDVYCLRRMAVDATCKRWECPHTTPHLERRVLPQAKRMRHVLGDVLLRENVLRALQQVGLGHALHRKRTASGALCSEMRQESHYT
eukprot:365092-Chlamydomonas_euryale.AAC.3